VASFVNQLCDEGFTGLAVKMCSFFRSVKGKCCLIIWLYDMFFRMHITLVLYLVLPIGILGFYEENVVDCV